MTDTVQVPRELLERALTNIHYSRRELGSDESKTERDLRKVLAAAPPSQPTDTVQVPREDLANLRMSEMTPEEKLIAAVRWLAANEGYGIQTGAKRLEAELRAYFASAPQVAAEPAWFVVETPGADFDWSFFKTEAEARDATHRGDGSDPVITALYTHAEPVNQQLLEALRDVLATREAEAKAKRAYDNAAANYMDASLQQATYEGAMIQASAAEHKARAAIASAEAQPALPTQEQIMRLADEYSFSRSRLETCEPYDRRYQRQEFDEARAALKAALSALPKEQP